MRSSLSGLGAAALAGLAVMTAIAEPTAPPVVYRADVPLSATVLAMGGIGYETIETDLITRVLGGRYAGEDNLVGLPWPGQLTPFNGTLTLNQSVSAGLETMDAAIRSTAGPKIVIGASGSTLVVGEQMRRLAGDPTAPAADELSFVVLGDANRGIFKQVRGLTLPILDYTVRELPVTKYSLTVVSGEYDGLGDWPDRPWNLLADLNALAGTGLLQQIVPESVVAALGLEGFGSVHYDAMFADLSTVPKENITTTVNKAGGVTTTYLVPTPDLPLLRPLTTLGVAPEVVSTLDKVLRPIIDSAYIRNDPAWLRPAHRPEGVGPVMRVPRTPVRPTAAVAAPAAAAAAQTGAASAEVGRAHRSRPAASHQPRGSAR